MSSARPASAALTPAQRRVLHQKVLEGQHSPQEWVDLMWPLWEYDRHADRLRKRLGRWVITVLVVGVALAFAAIFFAPVAAAVIAVVTAVVAIVIYGRYRFVKRSDLYNGPLDFTLPLLPILGEDVDPESPVALRLDLRGPLRKDKRRAESKPYRKDPYYRVVDSYYEDPWLSGSASFVDGAQVSWTAVDHITSQKKTKRNARGKIKTKVKRKKKTTLEVSVAFPAKNYANSDGPQSLVQGVRVRAVKPKEDRTTVRLSHTVKTLGTDAWIEPRHFIDLVARAYQQVAPARRKKL